MTMTSSVKPRFLSSKSLKVLIKFITIKTLLMSLISSSLASIIFFSFALVDSSGVPIKDVINYIFPETIGYILLLVLYVVIPVGLSIFLICNVHNNSGYLSVFIKFASIFTFLGWFPMFYGFLYLKNLNVSFDGLSYYPFIFFVIVVAILWIVFLYSPNRHLDVKNNGHIHEQKLFIDSAYK